MELANILELIHAVSDSDLTEFNLQDDTLNISMSKEKTIVQQMAVNTDPADAQQYQPVVQQAVHVESVNAVNDEVQTGSVVKSPLVGTYYAASSPENPPFVKVGDKVSKGQVLGIVEAMKLMNEIESEFDGTVKEILVENEQMVEFGQPMFVIEQKKEVKNYETYNKRNHGDHSPQTPVLPGVLIVEALAQTGAVAILSKPENKGKIAYFASINNAKFKNKVVPGDTLTLEVEIIKEKGPMGVGKAKATNQDGKVAVIAELTFAVGA